MIGLERRALTGTIAYAASELTLPLLNIMASVLVVRALGKAQYGELALILSVVTFVAMLLDPGLSGWVIAEIARRRGMGDQQGAAVLVLAFTVLQIVWGAILGIAVILIGYVVHHTSPPELIVWMWVAGYIVVTGWDNAVGTALHAYTLFARQVTVKTLQHTAKLLMLAVLWRGDRLSLAGVVASYTVGTVLPLLTLIPFWLRLTGGQRVGLAQWYVNGATLRRALPAFAWNGLRLVPEIAPLWFLRWFAGLEAVATYQVGFRAFAVVHSLLRSVESAVFPLVSEGIRFRSSEVGALMIKTSRALGLVVFCVVPTLIWLAPWIVAVLYGSQYASSVPVFRVCVLALLAFPLVVSQRPTLFAMERIDLLVTATASAGLVYLLTLGAFVPHLGPNGAALALVAYMLSVALLTAWLMRGLVGPSFQLGSGPSS